MLLTGACMSSGDNTSTNMYYTVRGGMSMSTEYLPTDKLQTSKAPRPRSSLYDRRPLEKLVLQARHGCPRKGHEQGQRWARLVGLNNPQWEKDSRCREGIVLQKGKQTELQPPTRPETGQHRTVSVDGQRIICAALGPLDAISALRLGK